MQQMRQVRVSVMHLSTHSVVVDRISVFVVGFESLLSKSKFILMELRC